MENQKLTEVDFAEAAKMLNVPLAAVKAVQQVETGGKGGFLPDGRPTILFEGHVFWRELVKEKLEPNSFAEQHPGVVYKEWTNKHYAGGAVEYIRLTTAESIHRMAALRSASWGMFQIMGFNHKQCGFTSVADYVAAMQRSEGEQLQAFAHFVQHDTSMLNCLQKLDWAAFARAYNGPSYAANKYDERLAAAYKRFSA